MMKAKFCPICKSIVEVDEFEWTNHKNENIKEYITDCPKSDSHDVCMMGVSDKRDESIKLWNDNVGEYEKYRDKQMSNLQ